jgi:hypothetical protein
MVWGCGLDSTGFGDVPVAGFSEHDYEPKGFTEQGPFLISWKIIYFQEKTWSIDLVTTGWASEWFQLISFYQCEDVIHSWQRPAAILQNRSSSCDYYSWPTRPLVRGGALHRQNSKCQPEINILLWDPDGARHQDGLTDWSSVVKWLLLEPWYVSEVILLFFILRGDFLHDDWLSIYSRSSCRVSRLTVIVPIKFTIFMQGPDVFHNKPHRPVYHLSDWPMGLQHVIFSPCT